MIITSRYLTFGFTYNLQNTYILLNNTDEVKWKNATWKNKMFKVLRRPTISILTFGLRVRDLIRK